MSVYQVQRCLFDHLRSLEALPPGADRPPPDVAGYALTDAERATVLDADVDTLYRIGVHPVIINGFCRALGWRRADYRVLFREGSAEGMTADTAQRRPRWRAS